MSVILNFKVCEDSGCNSINFFETTGPYNSITNPYGWTDEELATADLATLVITTPSNLDYTINLFNTGNFPNSDPTVKYKILPTDIGLSDTSLIPDGIYLMTYTVHTTLEDVTYTQNYTISLYCQVNCCVQSMLKDIDVECDCSEDKIKKYNKAFIMLQGLKKNCGNVIEFNKILNSLQKLCKNSNCKNCK